MYVRDARWLFNLPLRGSDFTDAGSLANLLSIEADGPAPDKQWRFFYVLL